jgi:hypothetical protein
MNKEFVVNYIRRYQEFGLGDVWGLNLALRNRGINTFENVGFKEIDFPSIAFTTKSLESIKVVYESNDVVNFEIDGLIYDSEDYAILSTKIKMILMILLNEHLNDDDRAHFIRFKL